MKTGSNFQPLTRLWAILKDEKVDISIIYIYAFFNGIVALSLPLGIQAIINIIVGGEVSAAWLVLVGVVIVGIGIAGWMQVMQLQLTEYIQQKIFMRTVFDISSRLPRMKMEALEQLHVPELVNRYFDTMSIQKGTAKLLIEFSKAALKVIFGLILLSFYHPVFIAFSIILLLLILFLFTFTGWKGFITSLKESTYKYEMAHWLEEIARAVASFKLAGKTSLHLEKTDAITYNYLQARNAHFSVLKTQFVSLIVFKIIIAASLLLVGGYLVINQQMNVGQFVAAEIIIIMIISSVEKLIRSLQTVYDVLTSLEKLGYIQEIPLENEEGKPLIPSEVEKEGIAIKVNHLNFYNPSNNDRILKNISLEILPGERVGIIGKNGSGKSVLLRLIGGLYTSYDGLIQYNGISLQHIQLASLRTFIGNNIYEDDLFEGTLAENITLGRSGIAQRDIMDAMEETGLNELIKDWPSGIDTVIGHPQFKLSRSIKNRIILARSIIHHPGLILMEDWVGRIEDRDMKDLSDSIFRSDKRWTVIAITNNPNLISQFEKIILLENGEIAALGTFKELKASGKLDEIISQ